MKIQQQICYLTYQSFPAETANSLQTISNIKYLVKNGVDVELIFPLRENSSNASVKKIKEHYSIKENFHVTGVKHFLPFGRISIFESFFFHISHFLWSYFVVTFKIKKTDERQFITRSDWILYFLARKGYKVLFECHQTSKIRTFIINKSKNFQNVKFIFLNEHLQNYYSMTGNNAQVLHNGVDTEMFNTSISKLENKREGLIFVGNLRRFNESRGIDFIIDAFKASKFLQGHKLSIIGGPDEEAQKLRVKIRELKLQENITVSGRLKRSEIGEVYANSNIGILVNSSSNQHSYRYTSPLKYFEYLYMGLKVIGVDFPSHRALPRNSEINFFQENDISSFETAVKQALEKNQPVDLNKEDFSLNTRAKKIISLLN